MYNKILMICNQIRQTAKTQQTIMQVINFKYSLIELTKTNSIFMNSLWLLTIYPFKKQQRKEKGD